MVPKRIIASIDGSRRNYLNQDKFARKLAITQSTVSKYEKGEIIPPAQILLKIAKLGETTIEGILEGEEG